VATALLVLCELKAARRYLVTANAMDAAAIAILFSTFFAAHALWNLIPAAAAFVLLALVTALAVLLSIRRESLFIAVLGLLLWDRYAVVLRSATQQVRSLDFVAAAKAVGASTPRIVLTEVLPNVMSSLIIVATFEVAHAILLEAALSFLGLGVQPPLPSWGLMIAEGRQHLLFEPWVIVIPGIALSLLVLSVNMLGDGIRDLAAPESRN